MTRRGSTHSAGLRVAAVTTALAWAALACFAVAAAVPADGTMRSPAAWAWVVGTVVVGLQGAALLRRTSAPRSVLLATSAGMVIFAAVGLGDQLTAAQLAVLVATYSFGLTEPFGRAWPVLGLAVLLIGAGSALSAHDAGETVGVAVGLGLGQGVGTVAMPWLVAVVVAARREIAQARAGRSAALAREQDALLQAAIARERAAMARELHDIAAHHLSGIAVMTAAIGTQIDADPAAAKAGVAQVRQQSRAVLRDLRSLVGLLRDDTETGAATTAQVRPESLAGLPALVEEVRAPGRDVVLTVLDHPGPPPAGVGPLAQLAAYRMVQESLANAARHAPGAATEVTLDQRGRDTVTVTVRNAAPPTAAMPETTSRAGFGIVGMRERAELTGATLECGPTPEGGWQVRLEMPREQGVDLGVDSGVDLASDPGKEHA
ncbi:sensor histidine kinase [Nocardioides jishulii]|uniref:histidine kinase n=1 Tax=Nocardioides jishulii TaxID=2575440 RepID=A0A4U2YIA6_9ACTN|nr:histidine kinase [Nocardioides jishulii]QCX28162.1 sensor histidine kinase [Nocardioides jishulii]TKI60826.1 sensor histidine kinase [Nocardioides jishulii]